MLFRCLERRLNLNLMLQKASTFETMHFHRPLSCGQRCVDVNNIIKICWEGNQQLLKGCKNHFHGYWKHVRNMSFFCLCVSLKRSWLTRRPVYVCVSSLDAERLPSSACQSSSCETQNRWLGVNGLQRHQATAVLKHLVAQAFHVAFEQSKSSTRRKDPAVINQAPNANSQQLSMHSRVTDTEWATFEFFPILLSPLLCLVRAHLGKLEWNWDGFNYIHNLSVGQFISLQKKRIK